MALTADNTVVIMAATDYVAWTEPLAEALQRIRASTASFGKGYEVGLLGQASPRARAEMEKLGFRVTENLGKQMDSGAAAAPR